MIVNNKKFEIGIPLFIVALWVCVALVTFATSSFAYSTVSKDTQSTQKPFQLLRSDIEDAIANVIVKDGVAEHIKVSLTSSRAKSLYRHHLPLEVKVEGLDYSSNKNKWSANLLIMDGDKVLTAQPISGRFELMQMVPVLVSRVYKGDIITKKDIEMKPFLTSKIRKDTIMSPNKLVGFTPRRIITNGRPVRNVEIKTVAIVKKGDVVHMRYRTKNMEISTIGEALEEGAAGDIIRIKNKSSGVSISGEILSDSEVIVKPLMQTASAK